MDSQESVRCMELVWLARRVWKEVTNLLPLAAFFCITALLFRSWEFALAVTASLGFHELGHVAALAWYGLDWRIYFGLVGAWTWSPMAERLRLSHWQNSVIHLAGPVFSLLLSLIALALQSAWKPADPHLLLLASFSAQVGLLNLLPLGALTDGGKVVRRMMESLERGHQVIAMLLPMLVTVGLLVLYTLILLPHLPSADSTPLVLGALLVSLWMASSLGLEAVRSGKATSVRSGKAASVRSGKTALARSGKSAAPRRQTQDSIPVTGVTIPVTRRMSLSEVYGLILVMWDLLMLGLLISAATPFWLAPEYVLGSLQNILAILRLFLGV